MVNRIFFTLLLTGTLHAADLKEAYQEGMQFGIQNAHQAIDSLKSLDISQFPGYEPNIPQETYYKGVAQSNSNLEADAQQAVSDNEAGNAVSTSFNSRPFFEINSTSESMQRLNDIAEHGDEIMRGEKTDKITCALKPQTCQYRWEKKTCFAAKGLGKISCLRTLHVGVNVEKTHSFSMTFYNKTVGNSTPYTLDIHLNESNTCASGQTHCYTFSPALSLPKECVRIKTTITDEKRYVVIQKEPTCQNPTLTVRVGKCIRGRCGAAYAYSVVMTVEVLQSNDTWNDQCQTLQKKQRDGLCTLESPLNCVEPNETRQIDGVSYTRSCWKEKAIYSCGNTTTQNTCDALIKEGCEQSNATCRQENDGQCLMWEQTYQCPLNQCTDNQLICGEDAFCLDGNCSSEAYEKANEEEFKKAMSVLSAASEASKSFNVKENFIFTGEKLECSRLMLDAKNCCRDSGWGIDLNLFHCTDSEKKLGKARENKLVIPTGEYCYERVKLPGGSVCKDTHQTYCVFQSKLARIVQEQGRFHQLHIPFGEGETTNCSGITPQQMQLLQFESIDFSEFYQDVKNKMKTPDDKKTTNAISQRMGDFYHQGSVND